MTHDSEQAWKRQICNMKPVSSICIPISDTPESISSSELNKVWVLHKGTLCYTIKPQITLFSLQWLSVGSVQLREKNAQVHCEKSWRKVWADSSTRIYHNRKTKWGELSTFFSECTIIYIIVHFWWGSPLCVLCLPLKNK